MGWYDGFKEWKVPCSSFLFLFGVRRNKTHFQLLLFGNYGFWWNSLFCFIFSFCFCMGSYTRKDFDFGLVVRGGLSFGNGFYRYKREESLLITFSYIVTLQDCCGSWSYSCLLWSEWCTSQSSDVIKLKWVLCKDENIGNHIYIGTSILRIYRRYIDGYFDTK